MRIKTKLMVYLFAFSLLMNLALSGCGRSVWQVRPEEQEPGIWQGDKYDAWFETTPRTVNYFGGYRYRYYGEITIDGVVYPIYVSFTPYYAIFLDAVKYDNGILDNGGYPTLFQANKTKSYKDGSFSSTVTLDKNNLFKGELPTIRFSKVS